MIRKGPKFLLKRASEEPEDELPNIEVLASGVDFKRRRIEIRAGIDETTVSIISRALIQMAEDNLEPIEILISSGGGSVYDGLGLYDMIRSNPCEIRMIASGQIMSMGFIVFLAGDIRVAMPHTTFMMHSLSYATPDNKIVKHHEVEVLESKRLNNLMLDIITDRTNQKKNFWYRKILLSDYFLNVDEAVKYAIINSKLNVKRKAKKVVNGKAKV